MTTEVEMQLAEISYSKQGYLRDLRELTWYLSGKVWTQPRIRMSQSFAVPSSEPLTISGGPLLAGQQLFTNEECSAIFLICKSQQARIFNKW